MAAASSVLAKILFPFAKQVGGVALSGATFAVGQAIADRSGLTAKVSGALLDLAGVPRDRSAPQLPPGMGEAEPETQDPSATTTYAICPRCHVAPIVAGAGESYLIRECDKHNAESVAVAGHVGALFEGWKQSYAGSVPGIGAVCGDKPDSTLAKYNVQGKFLPGMWYADLAAWQKCTQTNADSLTAKAKALADKAAADIVAATNAGKTKGRQVQAYVANFALNQQRVKYEQQINDIMAAQAQATTDAQRAALQTQIDTLTAQKAASDQLAAQVAQQTNDAAMKAQIDALNAKIASSAAQPGGMESLMQMMMMKMMSPAAPAVDPNVALQQQLLAQQLQQQSMIQQQTQQPMMVPGALPWAQMAPPYAEQQSMIQPPQQYIMVDPNQGQAEFYGYQGADNDAMDPEVAAALGISGAATIGEAKQLFALRQNADFSPQALAELAEVMGRSAGEGSCEVGACGIRT